MSTALLAVGDAAPPFEAPASDGKTYTLKRLLAAQSVVLVFYPGNNTPGWNKQLSAVRDELKHFQQAGVQPLGVNPASVDAHARYAAKMQFNFPLLSDPKRDIAAAYGALKPDGRLIQRTVYAIGRDGRIAFAARGAPAPGDVLAALERWVDPTGRVALVTGGARRVGRALALALADRGARIAIHHHDSPDQASSLVDQLAARGIDAAAFRSDLRKADTPDRLVADVVQRFGALDILVNSAAVMVRRPLDEITADEWDDTFALNLRAPFFCARAAARAMGERGGVIVNLADLAGIETWPAYAAHGISKAGVIHMTRVLARILAPRVRVNAIAPGAVLLPETWSADDAAHLERTTPLLRLGSPQDVAQAMLYLIEADYVTGDLIIVDGGRHIR